MQGSRTASITQSLPPSYVRYTMGRYPANALEYTFVAERLADDSPTFRSGGAGRGGVAVCVEEGVYE